MRGSQHSTGGVVALLLERFEVILLTAPKRCLELRENGFCETDKHCPTGTERSMVWATSELALSGSEPGDGAVGIGTDGGTATTSPNPLCLTGLIQSVIVVSLFSQYREIRALRKGNCYFVNRMALY